jgi:hypothetical protein
MASGISAEYVEFQPGIDFRPGNNVGFYILRPETAESLFVLNQLTKGRLFYIRKFLDFIIYIYIYIYINIYKFNYIMYTFDIFRPDLPGMGLGDLGIN